MTGNLPSADGKYSLYCVIIVKSVDARSRENTSIDELLRGKQWNRPRAKPVWAPAPYRLARGPLKGESPCLR
jgi:hypothetical protein